MTTAAIILAAGLSSRMGAFKPLLPLGESTALEHCVTLFSANDVSPIIVVTGKRADQVADAALRAGATPVRNAAFERGMFSSVLTGVRALPGTTSEFFMLPVDIPLVRPETIARLREEFRKTGPALLYPRYQGKRGHPPLIATRLAADILAHDGSGGLRTVLERHEADSRDLDVADFGTAQDMDTRKDYELALRMAGRDYPARDECSQLWNMRQLSRAVRTHSEAVARVALAMAQALNAAGNNPALDMGLVESAALVHDIGKGEPRHDLAGAKLLAAHGFHAAAAITATHSDMALKPNAPVTEREVVFLADKFVRGDSFTPLEKRYRHKLELFSDKPGAQKNILARLERAQAVLKRMDAQTGSSMELLARKTLAGETLT